jgi:MFS family permease
MARLARNRLGRLVRASIVGRILSTVVFNFVIYLTLGLPLAVLPTIVHSTLGYGPALAGFAVSLQYIGTLISRPSAGRMVDSSGPKRAVILGLAGSIGAGLLLVAASAVEWAPPLALVLIGGSRLLAGFAESWGSTGSIMWTIGRVGARRTAQVISWNGITSYGGLALGAPLGVLVTQAWGLHVLGALIVVLAAGALLFARPRPPIVVVPGERLGFASVFGRVAPFGVALSLGSIGFGVLASFAALFYQARHWSNPALMLSLFGICFMLSRIVFASRIGRADGLQVALACFAVESVGLAVIWQSSSVAMALAGAALTGLGFALVFPSLGVEAVSRVGPANRGAALGAYSLFSDVALGVSGPLAGIIAGRLGYASVFLFACLSSISAFLLVGTFAVAASRARPNSG